jgi:hypothetical protein
MLARWSALLTILALSVAVGACGADDEFSSDIPRTSPDLTIPTATTELPADTTATTSTATTTSTVPDATTPPAAVAPPAAVTPPPVAPPSSTTGGAAPATGGGGTPTTGGAQPGDGEFENFCRDNPGAGPPC